MLTSHFWGARFSPEATTFANLVFTMRTLNQIHMQILLKTISCIYPSFLYCR